MQCAMSRCVRPDVRNAERRTHLITTVNLVMRFAGERREQSVLVLLGKRRALDALERYLEMATEITEGLVVVVAMEVTVHQVEVKADFLAKP